jgi:hypothetical protein
VGGIVGVCCWGVFAGISGSMGRVFHQLLDAFVWLWLAEVNLRRWSERAWLGPRCDAAQASA